jgi:glycyl-tRNA synthetase beta chain
LAHATQEAQDPIQQAREQWNFAAALAAAVPLAEAVDTFFTDVLVNADDPGVRARRYGLVRDAAGTLSRVADFERVTDGGGAR